jgi:hypothetical protein
MSVTRRALFHHLWPYLLLIAILALVFAALALIGLDLGFNGDVLGFEYHFQTLGLRGGMRYVLEWDRRHLLSGQFYALLHYFFPGQSAAWYGTSLLTQFLIAPVVFLFSDTILRGRWRWLSFAAALVFAFHTRQTMSHFETPTSGYRKIAMALAVLSLWCYLHYVRGKRLQHFWRDFSIVCYAVAVMLYEATVLFFVIHPLIAYLESPPGKSWRERWHWLRLAALDSLWYPVIFGLYWYLLNTLLPEYQGPKGTYLNLQQFVTQITGAFTGEFSLQNMLARYLPAFDREWFWLTLLVSLVVFLIFWYWRLLLETDEQTPVALGALILIGLGIYALNVIGTFPGDRPLSDQYHAPRSLSPSAIGIAFVFLGALAWLLQKISQPARRRAIFAFVIAFLVGTGVTRLFQVQADFLQLANGQREFQQAFLRAVPALEGDVSPYIVIFSDAHPNDDLGLNAQDLRFPLMFDMMYDTQGIAADALFFDVPERFPKSWSPPEDMPANDYVGPYILVDESGIYSPLQPGVPIPPERLVIVEYNSQTKEARVLDELPPDIVARTNIVQRVPIEWETNWLLINS